MGPLVGFVVISVLVGGLVVFLLEYVMAHKVVDYGVVEGKGSLIRGTSDPLIISSFDGVYSDFAYADRYAISIKLDGGGEHVNFLSHRNYHEGARVRVCRGRGIIFGSLFVISVEPA
ncbi:MAG: hypothetical protein HYV65_01085 [Candidatus Spechtbacteria bacterium]|nr:hypothetical protein [Candidatus Spechtbacteria bacterium]